MFNFRKKITLVCLGMVSPLVFAVPKHLITHNLTDLESNAYIAGTIPSMYPTKPHSDGVVAWAAVRMACLNHTVNRKCPALIRIGTNTDHPFDLGQVELDLDTGAITPSELHANGYAMIVNNMAETTLKKE